VKKKLVYFILPIVVFLLLAGLVAYLNFKYENIYGNRYEVLNPTMMYWHPEYDIDNVSYYMFDVNDNLYCEYESVNNSFILCAWKFSIFRDPLFGWVKLKDLEKK